MYINVQKLYGPMTTLIVSLLSTNKRDDKPHVYVLLIDSMKIALFD